MVPLLALRTRIGGALRRWKHLLPDPLPVRVLILPLQRVRQVDGAETLRQIFLILS